MINLILIPFPPSVNDMFLNKRGRGRILSPKYRAWKLAAGQELMVKRVTPHIGPFRLHIQLDDSGKGDCDNRIKPVCDLLVSHGIIEGDQKKYMKGVCIEWAKVDGCVVEILSA